MKSEIHDNTEQYVDRYVAFLDLLGFKNALKNKACSEIVKIFSEIRNPVAGVYMHNGTEWKPIIDKDAIDKVNMKIMSDSVCFYIDAVEPNAFATLLSVCILFQVSMAELDEPVIMRGGVVRGEMYAKGDITFGPGLTAAYLLEEKSAKFPRIIMTGALRDEALSETDAKCKTIIENYTYRDEDGFYVIDYLDMLSHGPEGLVPVQAFYDYVIKVLDHEIDASIREKYLYLEKHIQTVLSTESGDTLKDSSNRDALDKSFKQ